MYINHVEDNLETVWRQVKGGESKLTRQEQQQNTNYYKRTHNKESKFCIWGLYSIYIVKKSHRK
jgi:hypothetical protein